VFFRYIVSYATMTTLFNEQGVSSIFEARNMQTVAIVWKKN